MKEILLTRGKVAIVDDEDYEWLNQWKWYCSDVGYAVRWDSKNPKQILMHRLINNTPDGIGTDHINRNKLDNRRCNLRECNTSQNGANRLMQKNNTSGAKGVFRNKRGKKWRVCIYHNYKQIYVGSFNDIGEADEAYKLKAKEIFGSFVYNRGEK